MDTWRDTSIAAYKTAFDAIYPELQKEVLNKITITDGAGTPNTITIADGKFTVVNAVEKISIDSTATASAVLAKLTLTGATVTGIGYTADIAAGNSGNMEIALNVGQASTVYVAYTVGTNTEPCVIGIDVVRAEPVAP